MATIKINGVTYPEKKRAVLPGVNGEPQVFELPEKPDAALNGYSENAVQNKVVNAAIRSVREQIASPFDAGGDVADLTALEAIQDPAKNEAHYVRSEKRWYAWTGEAWAIASMSEAEYMEELSGLSGGISALNAGDIATGSWIAGKYVDKTTGAEKSSTGWSCTDFVRIPYGTTEFEVVSPGNPATSGASYNVFYDSNKDFLAAFWFGHVAVPDGAAYFRLSVDSEYADTLRVMRSSYGVCEDGPVGDLVPNQYVNSNGIIYSPQNWARTRLMRCDHLVSITITCDTASDSHYCGFFDRNKAIISAFGVTSVGDNIRTVPDNAYYVAFSEAVDVLTAYSITCLTKDAYYNGIARAQAELTQRELNDLVCALVLPSPDDFVHGSVYSSTSPAYRYYTDDMIPMSGTFDLAFAAEGLACMVLFYADQSDSTYTRASGWLATGTRHVLRMGDEKFIRFEFSRSEADGALYKNDLVRICSSLCVRKWNPDRPYIRVCTFNLARDWADFRTHSSEDYSKWQIEHFLNLYGDIDPDILAMQEALGQWNAELQERVPGHYIDTEKKHLLFDETIKHKLPNNVYIPNDDARVCTKFEVLSYERLYYGEGHATGTGRRIVKIIIDYCGVKIGLFNTHLDYAGAFDQYQKPCLTDLCQYMQDAMNNGECLYAIATGDFNTFDNRAFESLIESKGFRVANCGAFGDIVTWPYMNFRDNGDLVPDASGDLVPKLWNMSSLDNVIVSPNIEIQRVGTAELYEPIDASVERPLSPLWRDGQPVALSDHYPFWADLKLN